MPTCLLTGATGFIGRRLVRVLQAAGGEVRGLVRSEADTDELRQLGVELVQGDVTQPETLAEAAHGVDFVFHLAGQTFARTYKQFASVNEVGCGNVAAACAAQPNPPVLIVVSSLAAVGPSHRDSVLREQDAPEPISHYGASKLAGELATREWASEVPTSIVRPCVVFGPRDSAGFTLVRGIARTGVHVVHRPGLPLSLMHADDLCAALLLVARHGERLDPTDPRGTGVYNAADPQASSYTDMGHMIAAALGRDLRVLRVRKWALWLAALGGELAGRVSGNAGPLSFDKMREGTASGWVGSTEKLVSQLDFACAAPLAERYQQTIDWYREEAWL